MIQPEIDQDSPDYQTSSSENELPQDDRPQIVQTLYEEDPEDEDNYSPQQDEILREQTQEELDQEEEGAYEQEPQEDSQGKEGDSEQEEETGFYQQQGAFGEDDNDYGSEQPVSPRKRERRRRRGPLEKKVKKTKKDSLDRRYQLQKIVAYVFVQKGYDLGLAREQGKCQLDKNKYNNLLTAVIRSSLRKLMDILISDMEEEVRPLSRKEEYLLRSPMVNCRKWLSLAELDTFFKIINEVYQMKHPPIYEQEVLNLFAKVKKQFNKRDEYYHEIGKKKFQSPQRRRAYRPSPGSNFTPSQSGPYSESSPSGHGMQKEVAELYVKLKNQQSVISALAKRYQRSSWPKEEVKAMIDKLIKVGIKKVLKYRKEHNLMETTPQLNLKEGVVNRLLSDPGVQDTRLTLVQVLMEGPLTEARTLDLLSRLAHSIEQISS